MKKNPIKHWITFLGLVMLMALGLFGVSDMVAPRDAGATTIISGDGKTLTFNIDCYLGGTGCTAIGATPVTDCATDSNCLGTVVVQQFDTGQAQIDLGITQATYLRIETSIKGDIKVGKLDFNYNINNAPDQHFVFVWRLPSGSPGTFSDPVGEDNVVADGAQIIPFDLQVSPLVSGPPPNEPFVFWLALDNAAITPVTALHWTFNGNGTGAFPTQPNDAWVGLHLLSVNCSILTCPQGVATGQSFWAGALPDTVVPEPASLLLLGSGLAGLALWRRREQG